MSTEERQAMMPEILVKLEQMRKETTGRAIEVLTPQQREIFEKLQGAKINLDTPPPPPKAAPKEVPAEKKEAPAEKRTNPSRLRAAHRSPDEEIGAPPLPCRLSTWYSSIDGVAVSGLSAPSESPDVSHCVSRKRRSFDAALRVRLICSPHAFGWDNRLRKGRADEVPGRFTFFVVAFL